MKSMKSLLIRLLVLLAIVLLISIVACTKAETAELEVSSLEVTPAVVLPGQEATVEADVANVGRAKATLTTTLTVNGVEMDTRALALAGGATDKVSFTVIRDLAGTYELSVDGQSTTLTVAEAETYNSERYLYSISYPSGWVLDESVPEKVTMVRPGLAEIGVSTLIFPVSASLDEIYAILVDDTKNDFPDLRELSRTEVKEDGAVVAYDVMFAYTDQGAKAKMRLVVSKRGRYGFARWGEAREAVYEQNRPLLDACLESFRPSEVAVGSYTNSTHGFSVTLPNGWDGLENRRFMSMSMWIAFMKTPLPRIMPWMLLPPGPMSRATRLCPRGMLRWVKSLRGTRSSLATKRTGILLSRKCYR